MILDSEDQKTNLLSLIDNASIKCGGGILEAMYNLKLAVMTAKINSGNPNDPKR